MATSIITKTTDMIQSGREAEERRTDYICLLVLVDTTVPKTLALPVRDALDPRLPSAEVRVVGVHEGVDLLAPTIPDLCVALLGSDAQAVSAGVCELAAAGVPVAVVAESALDVPRLPLGATAATRVSVVSATSAEVLLDRLAEWLISATDKSVACAANFPFCRRAKVRKLIKDYAMENAMGTAKLGPRGELPSMTLNQARLALDIAAINGQPLALGRIPEVLSAVGAGFGSRMFANKALGKIPLVGWLFQAGFGYLGTQATGTALQRRFDKRERRAEGLEEERTPLTRRAADAARALAARRAGTPVRSSAGVEVRMLAEGSSDGSLVYLQEDQQ